MNRALFVINLVLVIATGFLFITIYLGLLGLAVLGVFQPICSIVYAAQWRTHSKQAKAHLRNYYVILGFVAIIWVGGFILDEAMSLIRITDMILYSALGLAYLVSIYFVWISRIIQKQPTSKFMESDSDVLDADFVDNDLNL